MKVLYDYQIFTGQSNGGVSRYFYELMNYYYNKNNLDFEFPIFYSYNTYIKNVEFAKHYRFFENDKLPLKHNLMLPFRAVNKLKSINVVNKGDFDLFHPSYYNPYFLKYLKEKPFVLTIYDMIYETYPEFFSANNPTIVYKKMLAQKALKIISISENTKKDIVKFYNIDEDKIEVIYLASSINLSNITSERPEFLPLKYILFVGYRWHYKNFKRFIEAINPLMKEDNTLEVLCVGGVSFTEEENSFLRAQGVSNRVKQCFLDDLQLTLAYKHALVFVFPSLYEGFGIPPLEAFECGCPVVASNTSSIPEVAGDACIYFDPLDVDAIKSAVEKVIYNENIRNDLIQKGYQQCKNFSWQKTAEETRDLYLKIV